MSDVSLAWEEGSEPLWRKDGGGVGRDDGLAGWSMPWAALSDAVLDAKLAGSERVCVH